MLLPLKQGLKQTVNEALENVNTGCYATSIKTRIETTGNTMEVSRIDTVVMLLPLKQGLKHFVLCNRGCHAKVVMLLPLKQGLKHSMSNATKTNSYRCYATSIKTRIETKQAPSGNCSIGELLCYFH